MPSIIKSLQAVQILDSRGNPTISVRAELEDGNVSYASVPSGASTGEFEAVELRDEDKTKYRGKGVLNAVKNVNTKLNEILIGQDASDQALVDKKMLELDGTKNKSNIGANAILGVSLAVAHVAAKSKKIELFEYLGAGKNLPVPLVNVINGGAHANNSLDVQEFMLVPHGADTFSDAVRISAEIFHALGSLLSTDGYNTGVGDEGGYAPSFESTDLAFDYLQKAIEKAGYKLGQEVSLALDVASSEFFDKSENKYFFKKSSGEKLNSEQMVELYSSWINKYPLVSIEDALDENDWDGWKKLTTAIGDKVQLVGDDLFVTNVDRINRGINEGIANSVLVKLNQIGSLSETLSSIETASAAGYTNVISHRSGETGDTTISDLAVATNAGQIKTGSMCRGERIEKYNRLLWIESKLGSSAKYINPFK